jgi:hypothetical protein
MGSSQELYDRMSQKMMTMCGDYGSCKVRNDEQLKAEGPGPGER